MKAISNKFIIISILFVVSVSIIFISNKSSDKVTLDEVKLMDNEVSKKQFAVYIRDSKDAEYQEYKDDNNLIPEGYKLDLDESGCVDGNGEKVTTDGIITQTTDNKITLKSNKTVYCYLYFEKNIFNGTGLELAESHPDNLTTEPVAELYRYVGTSEEVTNNYICFGADDCTTNDVNKENNLYRIIGITSEGNLKIQKNSSIGTGQWWTKNTTNKLWADSLIYTETLNNFYNNGTYVSSIMKERIENYTWNTGDVGSEKYSDGTTVYNAEKTTTSHTGAVGLAYLSDYYFAYNEGGSKNCYNDPYCKSWIIPSDYQTLWNNQSYEWTMTRYGRDSYSSYDAWCMRYDGGIGYPNLQDTFAVRPVFYLKSDSIIKGGSGTSDDPYILENTEETAERLIQEKFNGKIPEGFKTTPTGDMYRFVGMQEQSESINNYVCFGADDCSDNPTNDHLYRIIGITSDGKIKIQKNSSIGTSDWWTDYEIDKSWSESNIYSLLTGNTFYNSNNYVTAAMKNKIETEHKWNVGDVGSGKYSDGTTVYNAEYNSGSSKHTGAVGLAYLSDYYFAYNEGGTQNCNSSRSPYCTSWMIPSDATLNAGSTLWSGKTYEWTMTRYGLNGNYYQACRVLYSGYVDWNLLTATTAVRPVFYLKSNVTISGGSGTLNSPYIIN